MGDSTMSHEVQDKFNQIEARLDALEAPVGLSADVETVDDEEEEV